jgi:predicted transcriptional regulator
VNNLSVKVSAELQEKLTKTALATRLSQSELIRRALTQYLDHSRTSSEAPSAADLAGDLAGSVQGGTPDLASNQEYLEDFGQW